MSLKKWMSILSCLILLGLYQLCWLVPQSFLFEIHLTDEVLFGARIITRSPNLFVKFGRRFFSRFEFSVSLFEHVERYFTLSLKRRHLRIQLNLIVLLWAQINSQQPFLRFSPSLKTFQLKFLIRQKITRNHIGISERFTVRRENSGLMIWPRIYLFRVFLFKWE